MPPVRRPRFAAALLLGIGLSMVGGGLSPSPSGLAGNAALAQQAQDATAVRTRAWQHPDFGRIVFDWPVQVGYQVAVEAGVLVVRFDRALTTDPATAVSRLPAYVESARLGDDGRSVRFALTGPVRVDSFRSETSVAVDLRPADAAAGTPPTPPEPPAQAAPAATADVADDGPPAPTALVPVSVEDGATATTLTFGWAGPVDYEVSRAGRRLTLAFDRSAAIDSRALAQSLPQTVEDLAVTSQNGRTRVAMTVPDGAAVRDRLDGTAVVLEIDKPEAVAAAAAEDVPEAPDAPEVPAPESEAAADPDPAPDPESEPAPEPPATEAAPAETEAVEDSEAPVQQAAETEAEAAAELDAEPDAEPDAEAGPPAEPETVAEDAPAEAEEDGLSEEERALRAAEDAAAEEAMAEGQLSLRRDQADRENERLGGPPLVTFTFQWPEAVGAAVFRRADDVWVVFDVRAPLDLAPLRAEGEPYVERLEQLPVSGATVLRMRVPDLSVNPSARREGFDWVVDLRKAPQKPRRQVEIEAVADADTGPHLRFPTEEPARAVRVPDPDVGDQLRIATFRESGHGVDGLRRYPEFDILPSAQGVVIATRADFVLLDRSFEGYSLTAPEGLHISAISPETPVSEGAALSASRLFAFERWQRGGPAAYVEARRALLRAVTEVPEAKRNEARLDLARFYLSRDYAPEAHGIIQVVESEAPDLTKGSEFAALKGAVLTRMRDYEAARGVWNDPRLDGFAESAVWRGAVLAGLGDYKRAHERFRNGESVLRRYPYPLKGALGITRIEAALANRDLRTATSWINELDEEADRLTRSQRGDLRYHQARVAAARTDFEQATDIWRDLVAGDDKKNAVRAEQALINLGLQQGDVSRAEAIERLEDLRYQWRGDRFELMVLRRLGELYLEENDYFGGLGAYRTAVSYFPDDPVSETLAQRMQEIFRRLYLEGEADKLPPLRALALYDAFRELTPSGPDGDLMIELLADRLVAVDLLGRAARVLQRQVEFRLVGEEKARVGAKLALIQLLDGRAAQAIEALNESAPSEFGLDEELQADRRRIRAKANFELGDTAEAIKLLAGDVSREADLLRRDIYWEGENWAEAAKVLQRLAGEAPEDPSEGVPLDRARHVVNWAVALSFDGDRRGIGDIREIFGPAMDNSELAGVFNFITAEETVGGANLSETVRELASGDGFNAFLEDYRNKLLTGGVEMPEPPVPTVSAETPQG